jgi:PKD repeat protein
MHVFGLASRLRRRRRSRGQSLVEFALIAPILLVFLATVLDLGRIYYANISLLNAAREGAFQASKTPNSFDDDQPCNTTTNLIVCRVQLESKGSMVSIDTSDIDVSCSKSGCPLEADSTVTVEVRGQFQLITPILGFIFGGQTIDINTSATTQIEYFPTGGVATLPPTPVAQFTASDTTGEAPFAISFDATASTGATDYVWDFGDGTYANGNPQVTHTYTSAGTYTVTLRIISLSGDATSTMTIEITAPASTPTPTPTATSGPTPTPTPTPEVCAYPPDVVDRNTTNARNLLENAGWNYVMDGDLVTGPSNKIQAQSPDHTECVMKSTTTVIAHYNPSGG